MIVEKSSISLAETKEILKEIETEKSKKIGSFIKKFVKIKDEDAKKLRAELEKLDIPKIGRDERTKIIDILPEDAEDLRKIFSGTDISLNQEETTKILDIVQKFRK